MTTLIVVESPTKAKKIQEILGSKYIVLATKGHITELNKGGRHGLGIDFDNQYKLRYSLMKDRYDIMDEIIKAANECDSILLAADPDREGTSIAWHVKERLEGINKPIKRLTFNLIDKKSIQKALKNNVTDIDMNTVHSQEARRAIDRIVGFKVSPFLTTFYKTNLSAGRVQSVAVRMIIDKEKDIRNFKPETYYNIYCDFVTDSGEEINCKLDKKITEETAANDIVSKLKTDTFYVSELSKFEELKSPPPPLITSTLQQYVSKVCGISSEKCMKAAQSLYENGFITYMRTDSVRVDPEAIKELRAQLKDKYSLPDKPRVFKNKDSAQDAHEAIRPSDIMLLPSENYAVIDPDEKTVYEAIWNHFVASQMSDAVFDCCKVVISAENNKDLTFKINAKSLKSKGFLEVLKLKTNEKVYNQKISKNDKLKVKKDIKVEKSQTKPPARYSESSLIKELDNKGIGRPSTYSQILSKITERKYVSNENGVFHGTKLGEDITDILTTYFNFIDYNYTKLMEEKLDKIEKGEESYLNTMDSFYPEFNNQLLSSYEKLKMDTCPKCKSMLVLRKNQQGKEFCGCSGYPKCFYVKQVEQAI